MKNQFDTIRTNAEDFAKRRRGRVLQSTDRELTLRVSAPSGFVTIQISIIGKISDQKVEVFGIGRNGIQTSRSLFSLKEPIDLELLSCALVSCLE